MYNMPIGGREILSRSTQTLIRNPVSSESKLLERVQ